MLKSNLTFLFFILFHVTTSQAQVEKKKLPDIYIGFSGGINFTQSLVTEPYGIISSINGTGGNNSTKNYQSLISNLGNQFHFEIWYPISNVLHLGLCPGIGTYTYNYKTSASWIDSTSSTTTNQQLTHNQRLRYFEIPLTIRYVQRFESLSPYLQAGGSYNILMSAQKQAKSSLVQQISGIDYSLSNESTAGDVNSLYIKSKFTAFAGVGTFIDVKIAVISIDASYHFGLNNITNEQNRYNNSTFSGSLNDVQDNLILNHLVFNVALLFPLNSIKRRGAVECIYFDNKKKK